MSLLLLFLHGGGAAAAVPIVSAGDAIVSIPNWGVPYKLPAYMKAIHYAPARWKPPRYKPPF